MHVLVHVPLQKLRDKSEHGDEVEIQAAAVHSPSRAGECEDVVEEASLQEQVGGGKVAKVHRELDGERQHLVQHQALAKVQLNWIVPGVADSKLGLKHFCGTLRAEHAKANQIAVLRYNVARVPSTHARHIRRKACPDEAELAQCRGVPYSGGAEQGVPGGHMVG